MDTEALIATLEEWSNQHPPLLKSDLMAQAATALSAQQDRIEELEKALEEADDTPAWDALKGCQSLLKKEQAERQELAEIAVAFFDALSYAADEMSKNLEKFHDYEDDTPEKSALNAVYHHLLGSLTDDRGNPISPARDFRKVLEKQDAASKREIDVAHKAINNLRNLAERYEARAETAETKLAEAMEVIEPFRFERSDFDFARWDEDTAIAVHLPRSDPRKAIPVVAIFIRDVLRARTFDVAAPTTSEPDKPCDPRECFCSPHDDPAVECPYSSRALMQKMEDQP